MNEVFTNHWKEISVWIICLLVFGGVIWAIVVGLINIENHKKESKQWMERKEKMVYVEYRGYLLPMRQEEKTHGWDKFNRSKKEEYLRPFLRALKKGDMVEIVDGGKKAFVIQQYAKEKGLI